jgi:putative transposase
VPDRDCADAIFYVLRTGGPWQALDQTEVCAHSTAPDRFQEWVQAGVFLKRWQAGIEQFDEVRGSEWQWLSMDGAMTKAPLGGEKNRAPSRLFGAKVASNAACSTSGHGVPIGLAIEGANRHDMKLARPTLESIIVEREDADAGAPAGDVSGQGL